MRTLWRNGEGSEALDDALVLWMPGPNSFTGEDVVELHVHGGPAVVRAVISAALATGLCRIAEPGEFSRRAFLSGRLDLTRAEALADLIDAETEGQRRQAQRQFRGEAAKRFEAWRELLIAAMASLEAGIDFPDEGGVPEDVARRAVAPVVELERQLERAVADARRGTGVRDGFAVAILGVPNAGKSSLLNRLAGREAAIVSPTPGTTRDIVEARIVLGGFAVWLADTAGLRETTDAIEAEGVRRALARAEAADLRIWVLDATDIAQPLPAPPELRSHDIIAINKIDLVKGAADGLAGDAQIVALSAETGEGVEELERRLESLVVDRLASDEPAMITRERHLGLCVEALDHARRAITAARTGRPPELIAEDLRLAARALGRITGTVDVEDLLDRIFAEFCIGK